MSERNPRYDHLLRKAQDAKRGGHDAWAVQSMFGETSKGFHGRVSLLVDRHTASAAEMIVAFARENNLARIVGEKTAGRLLSATSVKVGQGFRLALPTGAYYTWKGTVLEGTPIEPDERIDFDWQQSRAGIDGQLEHAVDSLRTERAQWAS
jgi:C-terminal processing protease CtpA/Prc